MKKMIVIMLMLVIAAVLTGCSFTVVGNTIQDWTSPDGMHYWVGSEGGIAPRYDWKGNIVSDGVIK